MNYKAMRKVATSAATQAKDLQVELTKRSTEIEEYKIALEAALKAAKAEIDEQKAWNNTLQERLNKSEAYVQELVAKVKELEKELATHIGIDHGITIPSIPARKKKEENKENKGED